MNKPTDILHIPDTQSAPDARRLAIQRVGVKELRYPLRVAVAGETQTTAATWTLDVALPAHRKGTHMSRFVAWLETIAALEAPLDTAVLAAQHARMLELRWLREELRVSFFAQELRTPQPVSIKRLDKVWAQLIS